ncbi:MAG: alpha/beta hydrolase [Brevundimonas sp.]
MALLVRPPARLTPLQTRAGAGLKGGRINLPLLKNWTALMPISHSIVLVHGAFVDGSGWRQVHDRLTEAGHEVLVTQNPTQSFEADVEVVARTVKQARNPVILVGHSYGGAVITEAGNDPKVRGLVYVAAFVPDSGESVADLVANPPAGATPPPILADDGWLSIDRDKFADAFSADLAPADARFMAASQAAWGQAAFTGRVVDAAWRSKSSHYIVATQDRMIPPPAQHQMAARAGARTTEIEASHAVMISHPADVAELILSAAYDAG